ncbi:hypothetical protein CHS0354_029534 [Potamilus streckersoni]|uniref:Uncharacterized protein n=1 Tax=Potamilus streckersoni TaxID=2493646 RepID=A0AAE0SZT4_9BIVA|nr:hypothetical protein CHS0354_029534 [Potamilus streckersoni]
MDVCMDLVCILTDLLSARISVAWTKVLQRIDDLGDFKISWKEEARVAQQGLYGARTVMRLPQEHDGRRVGLSRLQRSNSQLSSREFYTFKVKTYAINSIHGD